MFRYAQTLYKLAKYLQSKITNPQSKIQYCYKLREKDSRLNIVAAEMTWMVSLPERHDKCHPATFRRRWKAMLDRLAG